MVSSPLAVDFYNRPVQFVARDLLGTRLVRNDAGMRLAGYITETEAYDGESDLACHARAGRTHRTEVMYGEPGRAYIYFIYGVHWMLNCVTGEEGWPAAVLIRAIQPVEGEEEIARRRHGISRSEWTNGPAKICRSLLIDGCLNGCDLTDPFSPILIEPGFQIPESAIGIGSRIGIQNTPEPWRSIPWRYYLERNFHGHIGCNNP